MPPMSGKEMPRWAASDKVDLDPKSVFTAMAEISKDPEKYGVSEENRGKLKELVKILGPLSDSSNKGFKEASLDKEAGLGTAIGMAAAGVGLLAAGIHVARKAAKKTGTVGQSVESFLRTSIGAAYTAAFLGTAAVLSKIAPDHPIAAHAADYDRMVEERKEDIPLLKKFSEKARHVVQSMGDRDMDTSLGMITKGLQKLGLVKPPPVIPPEVVESSLKMHHNLQDLHDAISGRPLGTSKAKSNEARTYDDYAKEKKKEGGPVMEKDEWEARFKKKGAHTPASVSRVRDLYLRRLASYTGRPSDLEPPMTTSHTAASIRRIVSRHIKVAHRPYMPEVTLAAYRDGMATMLYFIDADKNHSKFYEMAIVPDGMGTYTLKKMWGALTDLTHGKRPTKDEMGLDIVEAKRMMAAHARSKLAKGYQDAFKNRPLGQYPVGLERSVGFGWGTQSATVCVPALRNLLAEINGAIEAGSVDDVNEMAQSLEDAQRFIGQIEDSSMLREIEKLMRGPVSRLRGKPRFIPDPTRTMSELKTLSNYLRRQLAECNV